MQLQESVAVAESRKPLPLGMGVSEGAITAGIGLVLGLAVCGSVQAQGSEGFTFGGVSGSVVSGHYHTYLPFRFGWSAPPPPEGADAEILLRVTSMTTMGNHLTTYAPDHEPSLIVWHLPPMYAQRSSYSVAGTLRVDMGYVVWQLFPTANVTGVSYFLEGDDNLDAADELLPECETQTITTSFGSG